MRLVRGQFCFLAWGTSLVSLLLTLQLQLGYSCCVIRTYVPSICLEYQPYLARTYANFFRVRRKPSLSILKALREEFQSDAIIFFTFFQNNSSSQTIVFNFFRNKRSNFLFFLYLIFIINIFIFSQTFLSNFFSNN